MCQFLVFLFLFPAKTFPIEYTSTTELMDMLPTTHWITFFKSDENVGIAGLGSEISTNCWIPQQLVLLPLQFIGPLNPSLILTHSEQVQQATNYEGVVVHEPVDGLIAEKDFMLFRYTVPSQSSWKTFLLPTEMVLKTEN